MAAKRSSRAASRVTVPKTFKMYVGGAFVRSESGRYLPCNDGKGDHVANLARASRKDFRDAVQVARAALGGWSGRSAFNRGQIVFRIAEMLEDRRASIESRLVSTAGQSATEAADEVSQSVDRLFWYAGWCDKFAQVLGGVNPVASPFFNFTIPEPVGVVTIFASRRSPLLGLVTAIAAVVLSGNTCIVICDPKTSLPAIDFAEVLATSDVPGGVVNILTGGRDELLPHVGGHRDVDAVLWLGSRDEPLRSLERLAADNVKRVRRFDDRTAASWRKGHGRSLYWIQPFVEWKTAWHPIGA